MPQVNGFIPDASLPPRRPGRRRHRQHLQRQARDADDRQRRAGPGHRGASDRPGRHAHRDRTGRRRDLRPRNPDMVRSSPSRAAPDGRPDEEYQVGDVVQFPRPTAAAPLPASCASSAPTGRDWALFDFNHPLAGQPVSFEVQLIGCCDDDDERPTTPARFRKWCWPSRAAFAPASTAPSRSSSARSPVRRADLRPPRDRAQHLCRQRPEGQGAIFIEDLAEVPRAPR